FHQHRGSDRLQAALGALACLHRAWANVEGTYGPCPAVRRRLEAVREWNELVRSGWKPKFESLPDDPVATWAERGWDAVQTRMWTVPRMLDFWADRPVFMQPCLCDIWHDHVLFKGHQVTGIIDYGSTKMDHVAVDLARLLGSLVGYSPDQWDVGLRAYRGFRQLPFEGEALAVWLDQTGLWCAVANWLKWLYFERRQYEDRRAVARRLAALVERMELEKEVSLPSLG